jgi:hypothetical protein
MRKHDIGEPPIARHWDFSSPEDAYWVVFWEDSEDDTGISCEAIWNSEKITDTLAKPTIVSIRRQSSSYGPCTLFATYTDKTESLLFSFYPDELFFPDHELVGKTESEAHDIRLAKDVAYLRS